jgi:flagellin-specific chaperone FliS
MNKQKLKKEKFTDNTFSVAKALHHISIAQQYFEDVRLGSSLDVKMIFNQYIQKCQWIISNLKDRLSAENREILAKELEDSLSVDAIADKVILLDNKKRAFVEDLIDSIIRGEEVTIIDEKK